MKITDISKEEFISIGKKYRELFELYNNYSECGDRFGISFGNFVAEVAAPLYKFIEDVIKMLLPNEEYSLSWWVFDTEFGKSNPEVEVELENRENKIYKLTNWELLYDFLVENENGRKEKENG